MTPDHPAITDWSPEGRAALVEAHRELFAALLYRALSLLAERYGEQPLLDAFRWDTLDDAVDWCLERFASANLDPQRLSSPLRTWKLFTVAGFWLAQRESGRGYARKMAGLRAERVTPVPSSPEQEHQELPDTGDPVDLDLRRLISTWVDTLRDLRARTCPGLITWWLRATERLRADWFDVEVPSLVDEPASKKARSVLAHDALFRFQALHQKLLREGGAVEPSHAVMREWLFRPCEDQPPYRRSEAMIALALPESWPRDKRTLHKLRREGVETLLARLIEKAGDVPDEREGAVLAEWQLLRLSVTKTTLTAFSLDEGASPELEREIEHLAELQLRGSTN